jgi:hypothetical protein
MGNPEGKGGFVFCGACGTRLDAGVRFCTSCGASQAQFADDAQEGSEKSEAVGTTPMAIREQAGGEEAASAPTEAMAQEAGGNKPPTPPPTGASAAAQPGGQRPFIESLFDVKFEHLITPKLVRFFYVLSMVVLAIGTIVTIVGAAEASDTTGVVFLFLAPLMALVYLIMIRLWLELIVVAFKIRDAVERVAENTERSKARP